MIIIGLIVLVLIIIVAVSIGKATERGVNRFLGGNDNE